MSGKPFPARSGKVLSWAAGAAILATTWSMNFLSAQTSPAPNPATIVEPAAHVGNPDTNSAASSSSEGTIQQTSCSSCSSGLLGAPYGASGGCSSCGGGGCPSCCYPGRRPCDCCWDAHTCVGKCLAGLYECICCPDPCYEPHWLAIADSAFFVDAARPVTQTRLRWDSAWNLTHPDRAEFFQARARTTPNQVGPGGPLARPGVGRGPAFVGNNIDYDDLVFVAEAATCDFGFGMFIEMLYRDLDPETAPSSPAPAVPSSGFGDMNIGTKSMLIDCELTQFTFQFKTFLPTGNAGQGLGVGHVSLEPSFLNTLKLCDGCKPCYLQSQWSYWIPIAGDRLYQGNIFHEHYSVNKVLCQPCSGIRLIGTCELNHWQILGGNFTSPDFVIGGAPVALSAAHTGFVSMGPGLRLFICDRIDFGVGTAFALTGTHWAEELIRAEFRWRFGSAAGPGGGGGK